MLNLLLRVALFVVVTCKGQSVCASSSNPQTNSAKECKYQKPCYRSDVPTAPTGYSLECESTCTDTTVIAYDRIAGTDVGELLPASCSNTVEKCAGACERTEGCCGFNFVFNPGAYSSTQIGRCVAKACNGRIGTSRYGMAYFARSGGAVTASPTESPTESPTGVFRPNLPGLSSQGSTTPGCVTSACRENGGVDDDCCGMQGSTTCAPGYDYYVDNGNSACTGFAMIISGLKGTCCVPTGTMAPLAATMGTGNQGQQGQQGQGGFDLGGLMGLAILSSLMQGQAYQQEEKKLSAGAIVGILIAVIAVIFLVCIGVYCCCCKKPKQPAAQPAPPQGSAQMVTTLGEGEREGMA